MKYRINVNVTADDIKNGVAGNCYSCPIASAISRVIHGRVSVRGKSIAIGGMTAAALPYSATDFVARFDHNQPVQPFAFELEVQC